MGNTPSTQKEQQRPNGGFQQQRQGQASRSSSSASASYSLNEQQREQQQSSSSTPSALTSPQSPARASRQLSNLSTTAQPSASLESAKALPALQSRSSATDALRSQAITHPPGAPHLRPTEVHSPPLQTATQSPTMGQNHSRHSLTPSSSASQAQAPSSESAKPIDAPAISETHSKKSDPILPIGPPIPAIEEDSYFLPASEFYGPPRLPLPIETEDYIPGSPVISPDELDEPIDPLATDYPPQKTHSILSDKTVDDEDVGDDLSTVIRGILPTVPTIVEWREPGNKVYVTGTFADWDRKYRLNRNGPSKYKDALSTTISLQPGTYHLRFIVDGDMVLSKYLPTAVDFTNSLVNYIEVTQKETPSTTGPQALIPPELHTTLSQPYELQPTTRQEPQIPEGIHPPLTLPPTPQLGPLRGSPPPSITPDTTVRKLPKPPQEYKKKYTKVIPQFLQDSDAAENSEEYRRATALTDRLPSPPSLPMFLNKSVLNGVTPMKDDASVLILPNHTVLNHLATSSIKNGVIATSATTRYKKKFLTSIMYKPTEPDD